MGYSPESHITNISFLVGSMGSLMQAKTSNIFRKVLRKSGDTSLGEQRTSMGCPYAHKGFGNI
jgi:hypothetical protein